MPEVFRNATFMGNTCHWRRKVSCERYSNPRAHWFMEKHQMIWSNLSHCNSYSRVQKNCSLRVCYGQRIICSGSRRGFNECSGLSNFYIIIEWQPTLWLLHGWALWGPHMIPHQAPMQFEVLGLDWMLDWVGPSSRVHLACNLCYGFPKGFLQAEWALSQNGIIRPWIFIACKTENHFSSAYVRGHFTLWLAVNWADKGF